MFSYITKLGSKTFLLPATIVMVLVFWIWYKNFRPAFLFGFGVLGTHLLNKLIKVLVKRERPSISVLLDAVGYSFPSGHAMVSIVFFGLVAYFISIRCNSKKMRISIRIISGCLILCIGLSRYILNVHYLTDILSGYVIGLLILVMIIFLYSKLLSGENRRTIFHEK